MQKNSVSHELHSHEHMVEDFKRRFWISLICTIPIFLFSPMVHEIFGFLKIISFPGDLYIVFGLSTFIFFYGGWPFLKGGYKELSDRSPGMMTLIGLAIIVAYIYSAAIVLGLKGKMFFWELASLIDIMLLGHWIEMRSVMGAGKALEELARLMPSEAHKIMEDGSTRDVRIEELKNKDRILVKPGEKIPADGKIIKGKSSINEAMLTGESIPVYKEEGNTVIGGSINGEGSITVLVEKTGDQTFLSQVIELVKQAQQSKSKTQNLADRAAFWLTIVAIFVGAATFAGWILLSAQSLSFALERTVSVMVITCPHALGLAVPLVVAVSTSIAASNGLIIRNRTAFERARNIQAIVFDKTGTLTKGEFGVTDVISFSDSYSEDEILSFAAAVESHSEHPLAKGILKNIKQVDEVENFHSVPGKGAEGMVHGKQIKVVSPGYLREHQIQMNDSGIEKLKTEGKTVVYLLIDNQLSGALALSDIIREESKESIRQFKQIGIRCIMITGDNQKVAKWVSDQIGLDEYFAEVLPKEKSEKIREVQERGMIVAMTGDGVNDAPALAQSDIGIAIGAGTDVAVETADIILVKNNPLDALAIMKLAGSTYQKMIQNLFWATGYNAIAIPAAAGAFYSFGIVLSPAAAAVVMSLSTIICAVNARMLTIEKRSSQIH